MSELYTSKIEFSTKELTAKEKVGLKKATDVIKLDEVVKEGEPITLDLAYAAKLSIHNEKNEKGEKDYNSYIIVDTDGQKYTTSSNSFWESFIEIYEEMEDSTDEWSLKILKRPSKNYTGKYFLTCDII